MKRDGGSSSGTVNTGVRAERSEALNTSITVPKLLPPSVPPIPRVFVAIRLLTPAPCAALGAARSPVFHYVIGIDSDGRPARVRTSEK